MPEVCSADSADVELHGFNLELRVFPLLFAHEVDRFRGDDTTDVLSLPVANHDRVRRQAGRWAGVVRYSARVSIYRLNCSTQMQRFDSLL